MPGRTTNSSEQTDKGLNGWRVKVNSEQVSFESFAEAGERLCGPDLGRELVPPLWSQNRVEFS